MSFRTIVVTKRAKLSYSLNYLIYRTEEKELKINISEITTLIIQSQQVAITASLLSKLIESKVKIIFCDSYNNPQAELVPYYGSCNVKERIVEQFNIKNEISNLVWAEIIKKKIYNQSLNLKYLNKIDSYNKLNNYIDEIESGDKTNREGHAAKVYFNSLFGKEFNRDLDNDINKFLNYGYSIILSAINREIKKMGYLTEIGIHHIGSTNPFNLSCDFIEPLRPLVDYMVISNKVNNENFKLEFVNLLNIPVKINNKNMILDNAILVYIHSLFNILINNDVSNISNIHFIEYERL